MGNDNIKSSSEETKKCELCRRIPYPTCSWKQGRCPHISSIFDLIMSDTHKTRFHLLFKKIKSIFK
jgi:hypothetical protein